jgi:hypothetical protein
VGRPTAAYWPDRGGRQRGGEVGRRGCCRFGGGGGRLGWHQGGGIRVGEGGGRALTEGGEAEKEMVEGPRWSWRGQGRPGGRASVGGAGRTGTGDSAGEATGRHRTMGVYKEGRVVGGGRASPASGLWLDGEGGGAVERTSGHEKQQERDKVEGVARWIRWGWMR